MNITAKRLRSSTLAPNGDGYRLTLTLADGAVIDLLVTFEQLDDLAEDIDRQLDTEDKWAEPASAA